MSRYNQLLNIVAEVQPKTILEIGTWNGMRACEMALTALHFNESVHYYGFDLFEDANETTDREEFNVKAHNTHDAVSARLAMVQRKMPGFTFTLIKGNTRETMAIGTFCADLVFIDGGHSVDTIKSDYEAVKTSPVIVFDDYYQGGPDTSLYGANQAVDAIEGVEVLPSTDPVAGGGTVSIAVLRQ